MSNNVSKPIWNSVDFATHPVIFRSFIWFGGSVLLWPKMTGEGFSCMMCMVPFPIKNKHLTTHGPHMYNKDIVPYCIYTLSLSLSLVSPLSNRQTTGNNWNTPMFGASMSRGKKIDSTRYTIRLLAIPNTNPRVSSCIRINHNFSATLKVGPILNTIQPWRVGG